MECKTVQIGATTYNYYEIPNPGKPKMLMLHGMMVESHCFEQVAEHLKKDFHLVLLDLKGHGKSSDGKSYDESYTNEAICADLKAIHALIIGEPCCMVGYSLGGQYTLCLAGKAPELLKRVVLIDSAPEVTLKCILALLWARMKTPKFFKNADHVLKFYSGRIPGAYMLKYCMRESGDGRYAIRYDKKNLAPDTLAKNKVRIQDIWAAAGKLKAPTLVLRAGASFVLDDKLENRLKESNPLIQVQRMEGMEHNLVFSHPREVAETISAFCNRPD